MGRFGAAAAVAGALTLAALAPAPAVAEGVDFIVMVDTSESMFTRFDDVVGYVLSEVLTRVQPGDSFHLLTFDTTARVVFSQRITAPDRFRQLVDQLVRLDGLGAYTDLVRAVEFLGGYAQGAARVAGAAGSPTNRNIILLTDGIHDPPPGAAWDVSFEQVLAALVSSVREIRRDGWSVRVLQLAEDATGQPGRPGAGAANGQAGADATEDATDAAAQVDRSALLEAVRRVAGDAAVVPLEQGATTDDASGQEGADATDDASGAGTESADVSRRTIDRVLGLPTLTLPDHLGTVGRRMSVPITITNHTAQPIRPRITGVTVRGVELLIGERAATVAPGQAATLAVPLLLPDDVATGEQAMTAEVVFAGNLRVVPYSVELRFTSRATTELSRTVLTALLITVVAVVAAALLFLLFRSLRNELAVFGAARAAHEVAHDAIEMRVEGQSRRDRLRNVRVVRPGHPASVGGGRSAFLVFLRPLPPHVAEVSNDGKRYRFTPLDGDRFPGLGKGLADCIGVPLTVRSDTGHTLTLTFDRYRSPLDELNELMRSVSAGLTVAEVMGVRE